MSVHVSCGLVRRASHKTSRRASRNGGLGGSLNKGYTASEMCNRYEPRLIPQSRVELERNPSVGSCSCPAELRRCTYGSTQSFRNPARPCR